MPKELIKEIEPTAVSLEEQPASNTQSTTPPVNQPARPGRTTDFSKLSLSELQTRLICYSHQPPVYRLELLNLCHSQTKLPQC